ncbi:kinase [Streptomyces sp. NPDC048514]|uniref:GHMP family kinase ATP-binding protein n=1 Tax=Streptomyces sp. NPDC048514 TaxID=3365564 RepID=UPI00371B2E85
MAQGTGRSFGTFGELLQGTVHSGQHFMVTCPLAAWSTATFRHAPDTTNVDVHPVRKWKAARIAMSALRVAGVAGGGHLTVHSELPEGKGLASSSADLVATVRAVAAAVGTRFHAEDIESLMREIEPSDGVMYDEIVDFDHRNVRVRERLGALPSMIIVAHDEGGQIDTVHYNEAAGAHTDEERREYGRLLTTLRTAVRDGDLAEVGRVATRSAELNTRQNPRRFLDELRQLSQEIDALGVVCAHSGTVLGILIDRTDPDAAAKTEAALAGCAALPGTTAVHRSLGHEDGDWSRQGALHLTHHQRM